MNGLLVINKPPKQSSHDVVNAVRRITSEKRVGHAGTLDPIATGVLPLVLGRFTRLAQFYNNSEKSYEGTIRLGVATRHTSPAGSFTCLEIRQRLARSLVKRQWHNTGGRCLAPDIHGQAGVVSSHCTLVLGKEPN